MSTDDLTGAIQTDDPRLVSVPLVRANACHLPRVLPP